MRRYGPWMAQERSRKKESNLSMRNTLTVRMTENKKRQISCCQACKPRWTDVGGAPIDSENGGSPQDSQRKAKYEKLRARARLQAKGLEDANSKAHATQSID